MAERSLWNLQRLGPGGPVHTLAWRVPLHGAFDERAMRRAFAAVVARHESLRTRFAEDEEGPAAIVEDVVELPLSVDDLLALSEAERAAEVNHVFVDMSQDELEALQLEIESDRGKR